MLGSGESGGKEGKTHFQGSGWNEWISYVGIAMVQNTEGGFQF